MSPGPEFGGVNPDKAIGSQEGGFKLAGEREKKSRGRDEDGEDKRRQKRSGGGRGKGIEPQEELRMIREDQERRDREKEEQRRFEEEHREQTPVERGVEEGTPLAEALDDAARRQQEEARAAAQEVPETPEPRVEGGPGGGQDVAETPKPEPSVVPEQPVPTEPPRIIKDLSEDQPVVRDMSEGVDTSTMRPFSGTEPPQTPEQAEPVATPEQTLEENRTRVHDRIEQLQGLAWRIQGQDDELAELQREYVEDLGGGRFWETPTAAEETGQPSEDQKYIQILTPLLHEIGYSDEEISLMSAEQASELSGEISGARHDLFESIRLGDTINEAGNAWTLNQINLEGLTPEQVTQLQEKVNRDGLRAAYVDYPFIEPTFKFTNQDGVSNIFTSSDVRGMINSYVISEARTIVRGEETAAKLGYSPEDWRKLSFEERWKALERAETEGATSENADDLLAASARDLSRSSPLFPPEPGTPPPPEPPKPQPDDEDKFFEEQFARRMKEAKANPFVRGNESGKPFQPISPEDFIKLKDYGDLFLELFEKTLDPKDPLAKAVILFGERENFKSVEDTIGAIHMIEGLKASFAKYPEEVKGLNEIEERLKRSVRGERKRSLFRFFRQTYANSRQERFDREFDYRFLKKEDKVVNGEGLTPEDAVKDYLNARQTALVETARARPARPAETPTTAEELSALDAIAQFMGFEAENVDPDKMMGNLKKMFEQLKVGEKTGESFEQVQAKANKALEALKFVGSNKKKIALIALLLMLYISASGVLGVATQK